MNRTRLIVGGIVAACASFTSLAGVAATPSTAESEIAIASVDVVDHPTVTAIVTAPITSGGYDESAFTVREGSTVVDATVTRQPTDGLEVMLVIDISESMAKDERLPQAIDAVHEFLALIPQEVRVGAVAYSDVPFLLVPPTDDRDAVRRQVAALAPDNETATYDAIGFAVDQFSPDAERTAVILLTDGEDTVSAATLDDAVARASAMPVHVITLGAVATDLAALDRVASAGGGSLAATSDPAALQSIYRDAVGTVANQYLVTYDSVSSGTTVLSVEVDTGTGTVSAETTIELPAAPATPPPTSTVPATTVPPTTVPATRMAPESSAATVAAATSDSGGPFDGELPLVIGGGATFLALLIIGSLVLTDDRRRRTNIRTGLGLNAPHRSDQRLGITETMTARADQYLERSGRSRSVATALEAAGISLRPGELVVLVLAGTAVAVLFALAVFGPGAALVVLVGAPLVARTVISHLVERRRKQFADQLADNLQLLTSGLKAGHGLFTALDTVASEASEPSRSEFRRVLVEARVGRDLTEAFMALAHRMASTDFEWVVGAIDINREIGGDLAETLDNVAETIRERGRIARQVSTLTAEGRMSAVVLTCLPILLAVVMSVINPGYLTPLLSGAGLVALTVGAALLGVGWIWMMRLIRLEF